MRKLLVAICLSLSTIAYPALAERFIHRVNANGKCLVYITYVRGNESETNTLTCKEYELSEKIYEAEIQRLKKVRETQAWLEKFQAERMQKRESFDQRIMSEGIHITISQLHDQKYIYYPDKNIEYLNDLLNEKQYSTVYPWWDLFNAYQMTRIPEDKEFKRNDDLMLGLELFMDFLIKINLEAAEITSWRFEKIKNECGKMSVVYIAEVNQDGIPYSFGFRKKDNSFPFAIYSEKELSGGNLPWKCNKTS